MNRLGKRFRDPTYKDGYRLDDSQDCIKGFKPDEYVCPKWTPNDPMLDINNMQSSFASTERLTRSGLAEMNLLGALEEILRRNKRADEMMRDLVSRNPRITFTPRLG